MLPSLLRLACLQSTNKNDTMSCCQFEDNLAPVYHNRCTLCTSSKPGETHPLKVVPKRGMPALALSVQALSLLIYFHTFFQWMGLYPQSTFLLSQYRVQGFSLISLI